MLYMITYVSTRRLTDSPTRVLVSLHRVPQNAPQGRQATTGLERYVASAYLGGGRPRAGQP